MNREVVAEWHEQFTTADHGADGRVTRDQARLAQR